MNINRHIAMGAALLLMATAGLTSCDKYNYTDQLQQLGSRVEILEQMVLEANTQLTALNEVVMAIERQGYVTKVQENADGTYTVTFNTGKSYTLRHGRQGTDGRDGQEVAFDISVAQNPEDGQWYWTLNGVWIRDANGNLVRAGAQDGRDGRDGQNGQDGQNGSAGYVVIPQVRINTETRNWEISTDGGNTWSDTGCTAYGKDGKDGADGKDGMDDMFIQVIPSQDGKSITFLLSDGRTFTVPVVEV